MIGHFYKSDSGTIAVAREMSHLNDVKTDVLDFRVSFLEYFFFIIQCVSTLSFHVVVLAMTQKSSEIKNITIIREPKTLEKRNLCSVTYWVNVVDVTLTLMFDVTEAVGMKPQ